MDVNNIVIIFNGLPKKENPFIFGSGQFIENSERRVSYYDEKLIGLTIDLNKKIDTIIINPKSEYIVLYHSYNPIIKNEFLLKKGDIVNIKYFDGYPNIEITNRNTLLYDIKYDSLTRIKFNCQISSPIDRYSNPMIAFDIKKLPHKDLLNELKNKVALVEKENLKLSYQLFEMERKYLDSLLSQKLITKKVFDYYKNRNLFKNRDLDILNAKMTVIEFKDIVTNYKNETTPDNNYKLFLEKGIDKFWLSNTAKRDFKDGVNRDYEESYNSIKGIKFLNVKDKNYLLTREIDRIAKSFSNKDFLEYFARFEKDVNDTLYVNHIKNKYSLKFNDKKNETNSLVLISLDKKQITFDDLKKRHAGKLIYVDFWASWCAPCRKAMPSSIKLKDKNKDVIFVYLSMDSAIEPWQKAMIDEKINNYSESYLIVNSETSNFLKKQNVSAIPRYMIFDKKGILAFTNAPSAESKELEDTFRKLLK